MYLHFTFRWLGMEAALVLDWQPWALPDKVCHQEGISAMQYFQRGSQILSESWSIIDSEIMKEGMWHSCPVLSYL